VFLNPVEKLSNSFLWKIFDVKIIDGVVNGSATAVGSVADVFRRLQSGVVQNYALVLMFGIIALLTWMVIP
jgi:NADH-quinone oxidoreductase subunit L